MLLKIMIAILVAGLTVIPNFKGHLIIKINKQLKSGFHFKAFPTLYQLEATYVKLSYKLNKLLKTFNW